MRAELLHNKRHVGLEVVVEVEGSVGDIGVEDGDFDRHDSGLV